MQPKMDTHHQLKQRNYRLHSFDSGVQQLDRIDWLPMQRSIYSLDPNGSHKMSKAITRKYSEYSARIIYFMQEQKLKSIKIGISINTRWSKRNDCHIPRKP